jgi:hypothetical protein
LENQDLGYQVPGRVLVELHNPPSHATIPQMEARYRQLEANLDRLPGVTGSGLALYNPLTNNWGTSRVVMGPGERGLSAESLNADFARTKFYACG